MANAAENTRSSHRDPAENDLLKAAWARQKAYSENASRYQERFVFFRGALAILSVLVVFLSVVESYFGDSNNVLILDWMLLGLPIIITALLAFSVKFDRGQNWILLRGNAESLKMEIYYYRTQVEPYAKDRDAKLAEKIKTISERVKGSPVHQGALAPYETDIDAKPRLGLLIRLGMFIYHGIGNVVGTLWRLLFQFQDPKPKYFKDDKFSDLVDAEAYINCRLNNQFNWYRNKAKELARQLQLLQAGVYFFGGLGTLLAAFDLLNRWVAVTAAMTGALTNYLEFKRVEASLVGYNQAADALYDIRAWWYSLPSQERDSAKNAKSFRKLVQNCEETIRNEHSSWLQDMQDRLSNLYGAADEDSDEDSGLAFATEIVEESSVEETSSVRVAQTTITAAEAPLPNSKASDESSH